MTKSLRLLATATLLPAAAAAFACTSLIATPGATADSSAIVTYAADSHTLFGELYNRPGGDHAPGEMRTVKEWDTGRTLGQIPEIAHTYTTMGNMNEHGLVIAESTWGGREELAGSGLVDYGSLIYITLERARTAREAVDTMTSLVSRFGYASEGESFSIADSSEVWIMELIGKGAGNPGAIWVARRVPDGYISGHANHSRIHRFPMDDPETLYSPDVVDFAREKGYYDGPDSLFSFSRAYAVTDAGALRGCDARVWSYFRRFAPEGSMDTFEDWILRGRGEPLPLWVEPGRKLTAHDLKWMMRDHFEGTCLDMTQDIGAGPFDVPYRWRPMGFTVDSVEYTHERAIATQQTGFSFVADINGHRHPAQRTILWFGVDDANTCVYVPVFNSVTTVPPSLRGDSADMYTLDWGSMFWVNNFVANQAYNRYSQMIPDIRAVQNALESRAEAETEASASAVEGLPYPEAAAILEDMTLRWAADVTAQYKNLGEYLFVKYLDGNIKKERDGRFARTPDGMPEQPVFGGYNERYFRSVAEDAGDRLRVVQPETND